jgi:hypothetical protein
VAVVKTMRGRELRVRAFGRERYGHFKLIGIFVFPDLRVGKALVFHDFAELILFL